jgi:membrane protein DedA with SNARE-associated domain
MSETYRLHPRQFGETDRCCARYRNRRILVPDMVAEIKTFLLAHKEWAGPILGFVAFGESLVIVGLFFPATAIMLLTGGLVQKGILDPATVIGWSVAGAILGDIVTYWLGRWIGPSVRHHWPLNRDPTAVAQARLFFRKFGFLSIFIGRFLGPVRSTIPLVAGMMKMKHLTFQIANVASAAAWVPFMLLPGYFAAKTIGDFGNISTAHWIGFIVLLLALTAVFTIMGARMQWRRGRARKQRRRPMPVL